MLCSAGSFKDGTKISDKERNKENYQNIKAKILGKWYKLA